MIKIILTVLYLTAAGETASLSRPAIDKGFSSISECAEYFSKKGLSIGLKSRSLGKEVKKLGGVIYSVTMECK